LGHKDHHHDRHSEDCAEQQGQPRADSSRAAEMFDEIIIRQDRNLRGRTEEEIIDFMLAGVKSIDPNKEVKVIRSEIEAINYAINNAQKGAFIVICSDVVPDALEQVMKFKEEEDKFELAPTDLPNIAK
jgi:cyanophycin synthetase